MHSCGVALLRRLDRFKAATRTFLETEICLPQEFTSSTVTRIFVHTPYFTMSGAGASTDQVPGSEPKTIKPKTASERIPILARSGVSEEAQKTLDLVDHFQS